jgi:hypothetical protein
MRLLQADGRAGPSYPTSAPPLAAAGRVRMAREGHDQDEERRVMAAKKGGRGGGGGMGQGAAEEAPPKHWQKGAA